MRSVLKLAVVTLAALALLPTGARPEGAPSSATKTIFDFDLDPIGTGDADPEKGEAKTPAAVKTADPPEKTKTPAGEPAETPGKKPTVIGDKADAPRVAKAPDKASAPAAFNDLAKLCHVGPEGVITVDAPVSFALKGTEGKEFTLAGEFYAAPEPTQWKNGGFYFYLRQRNGTHRYELSIGGMRAKRVLLAGETVKKFAYPMSFTNVPREKWLPFSVEARQSGITASFGGQKGEAKGPVATEGANVLILQPGAKLRGLKLTVLGDPK